MKLPTDFEEQFEAFIQKEMKTDAAHDLSHVQRVVAIAKRLAQQEKANLWIVLPAAYLHDCFAYPKDHPDRHLSSQLAADKALQFLASIKYPTYTYQDIYHAISAHSYSANIPPETIEAEVVQDADRLDSLGAIGIARCIQVSTSFNAELYSPEDPFAEERALDDKAYAVDHFFEKLFKLPETMNTKSAAKEANKRVIFMRQYLNQLRQEIG
ncbi:HD domain-containing protein [Vibrio breoganii]|uniref:HD domain-containing protein n=1 Tax=Vibrio breoganii TaxID=553239 RepID=UPI0021C2CEF0|nr:HD domain-containing protein [Vibrio breoganii]MDN3715337.1 HD domain-containing protein [Vibrio breoganii]